MAVLTAEERGKLADSDFAVPSKRLLPLHDEAHARQAWNELDATHGLDEYEREEARHRIMRALHRHGVRFRSRGGGAGTSDVTSSDEAREAVTEDSGVVVVDVVEAAIADEGARVVEVTIVRPGVSQNGYHYTEGVLRASVPLWDGAPAFLDHPTALDLTRAGSRSLRDLVGVYEGARYEEGRGIRAKLRLLPNDHGVFETVRESVRLRGAGHASPPIGISADWKLLKSPAKPGADGRARWNVHSITAVNSGDIVIRPSAGGSFDRILEGVRADTADAGGLELVSVENQGSTVVQPSGASGDPTRGAAGPFPSGGYAAASPVGAGVTSERAFESQSAVNSAVEEALKPYKLAMAGAVLDAKLGGSGLPEPARAMVRKQFEGRVFEASEVDTAIAGFKAMLGDVFGQSAIRGAGAILDPGVRQGTTPLEKIQGAFDKLFGLDVPAHLTGVPRLTGIREAYVLVTGDKFFSGQYHWDESIVREANETTTAVMSNVVKYAKQLQYRGRPPGDNWRCYPALPSAENPARALAADSGGVSGQDDAPAGCRVGCLPGDDWEDHPPARTLIFPSRYFRPDGAWHDGVLSLSGRLYDSALEAI